MTTDEVCTFLFGVCAGLFIAVVIYANRPVEDQTIKGDICVRLTGNRVAPFIRVDCK